MQCTENKVLHVFLEDENETFESRNPATPQFLHVQQTNQVHNDRKRSLFDGDLGFSFIISRIIRLTAPYFEALARRSLRSLQNQSHSGRRSR